MDFNIAKNYTKKNLKFYMMQRGFHYAAAHFIFLSNHINMHIMQVNGRTECQFQKPFPALIAALDFRNNFDLFCVHEGTNYNLMKNLHLNFGAIEEQYW